MKTKKLQLHKEDPVPFNTELLNYLAPSAIRHTQNTLTMGEYSSRIKGIVRYGSDQKIGWLRPFTNIPDIMTTLTYTPTNGGDLVEYINKSVQQQQQIAHNSTADPLQRQRAEQAVEDGEKTMRQIDHDGESVGLFSMLLTPMVKSEDTKKSERTDRSCRSRVQSAKLKSRTMSCLQLDSWQQAMPFYDTNERVQRMIQRVMPLRTVLGGIPFSASGLNDPEGYLFAKDASGEHIIYDGWQRGGDRTNGNFILLGVPGSGKSSVFKHIIMREIEQGVKIIMIDPEGEFREITRNTEGNIINAGGGGGMFNPFQVRYAPQDDPGEKDRLFSDEDTYRVVNGKRRVSQLALHMKTLEVFFRLYLPGLSALHMAALKAALLEMYEAAGITWVTDPHSIPDNAWPTMEMLHTLLKEKAEKEPSDRITAELAALLQDAAIGADQFLWNGQTNIDVSAQVTCIDTSDLQESPDNIKRAQYFNLLKWVFEILVRDREERVLLVCDEAYLMIDPEVPQTMSFLRNVSKRCRKYEGRLGIATHSVVDVLDPRVKMYGQALLGLPCCKILMGCDGQDLAELRTLYDLTDAETGRLLQKKQGQGILMIGSKRIAVNFMGSISPLRIKLMGKGGGR